MSMHTHIFFKLQSAFGVHAVCSIFSVPWIAWLLTMTMAMVVVVVVVLYLVFELFCSQKFPSENARCAWMGERESTNGNENARTELKSNCTNDVTSEKMKGKLFSITFTFCSVYFLFISFRHFPNHHHFRWSLANNRRLADDRKISREKKLEIFKLTYSIKLSTHVIWIILTCMRHHTETVSDIQHWKYFKKQFARDCDIWLLQIRNKVTVLQLATAQKPLSKPFNLLFQNYLCFCARLL